MAGCTCENWTIQDLACALKDMSKDNKRIVVPMFQRGKRWKKEQEHKFIDSVIKGYPVGTMLFYEKFENGKRTYILVDGLQRGNSIKKYMTNPTEFFYDDSISDKLCSEILKQINRENTENNDYIILREILSRFIKEQKTFKNLQYYEVAKGIAEKFSVGYEPIGKIIKIIEIFFEERQELYDKIASSIVPVIVYNGDEDTLPEIFDRINSQGTPLDQYEVYAASWPVNENYYIENTKIIEYVIRKYDTFIEDGFFIHGYNREEMRVEKEINAFEYLFGLSKYLVNEYSILKFNVNLADDTVNSLGFELVNACLNDGDKIKILYKNLKDIDINKFENALYNSIDFVVNAISAITKFKRNSRNSNRLFHSKYQILSMISTTFKEMYENGEYDSVSIHWRDKKQELSQNLMLYYVYDIITNYWSEGGTNKIHSAAKPNRYMIKISSRAWMVALDSFFEKSMLRAETKKVASLKSEEYVILNCIYLNMFTAMDQLSIEKFDVEHIAPKEQMKRLIEGCQGEGLPISCIANLCYLPEYINRGKKDKNFYQDKKYLENINLGEIEKKYSFTDCEDLEWMDIPYNKIEDFEVLKEYYTDYCTRRFDKLKYLLFDSLGIKYTQIDMKEEITGLVKLKEENNNLNKQIKLANKCTLKLIDLTKGKFIKCGKNSYKTKDDEEGFIIKNSKMYQQGEREKYWFAYRRNALKDIKECKERYIFFSCGEDGKIIIKMPIVEIEKKLEKLNASKDEEGNITHWHMVFLKDRKKNIKWLLSKPQLEELDITNYMIKY